MKSPEEIEKKAVVSAPSAADMAKLILGGDEFFENDSESSSNSDELSVAGEFIESGDWEKRFDEGEEIARGGMGKVSEAEDFNLRRSVAVKRLLDSEKENPESVLRFISEAQITGQLEHPGVVPVHELGLDAEGNAIYTMKHVKGETLSQVLRGIRNGDADMIEEWPLARLLRVFAQVCDTVAFAHRQGVIHRDLKPDNIMLGDYGEVLVLDWGIARVKGNEKNASAEKAEEFREQKVVATTRLEESSGSLLTMDGAICGTPSFMAPEIASGGAFLADESSDVFSLGAVLYMLLALRPPFQGENTEDTLSIARTGTVPDIRLQKIAERKGPRSWPEPVHCPERRIPNSLAAVSMKALHKDKEERYVSVQDLRKDVEAYLNGFATSAEGAGFGRQTKLFWQRNRLICNTVVAGFLIFIVGAIASVVINQQEKDKALFALDEKDKAEEAREKDRKTSAPKFAELARRAILAGRRDEALTLLETASEFDPELADPFLFRAVLAIQQENPDYQAARESLIEFRKVVPEDFPKKKSITQMVEACEYVMKGDEGWPKRNIAASLRDLGFGRVGAMFVADFDALEIALREEMVAAWGEKAVETFLFDINGGHTDSNGQHGYTLFLNGNRAERPIESIEILSGMPLSSLAIHNCATSDLSPLENMRSLRYLALHNMQVTDISPLRNLHLSRVFLSEHRIADLSPLSEITTLRSIGQVNYVGRRSQIINGFSGRHVKEIALFTHNLETLRNTKYSKLFLQRIDNAELDITPIRRSTPIQALKLWDFNIGDFSPLKGMTIKHFEWQEHKKYCDLSGLKDINIESLRISRSFLRGYDLNFIREMSGLKNLRVGGQTDYTPLRGLSFESFTVDPESWLFEDSFSRGKTRRYFLYPFIDCSKLRSMGADNRSIEERFNFLTPKIAMKMVQKDKEGALAEWDTWNQECVKHPAFRPHLPKLKALRQEIVDYFEKGDEFHLGQKIKSDTGNTYQWVGLGLNWEQARDFAEAAGGHLVTLTTEAEREFVWENVIEASHKPRFPTWLGAIRKGEQWTWITGEKWNGVGSKRWDPTTRHRDYWIDNNGGREFNMEIWYSMGGVKSRVDDRQNHYAKAFVIEWEKGTHVPN